MTDKTESIIKTLLKKEIEIRGLKLTKEIERTINESFKPQIGIYVRREWALKTAPQRIRDTLYVGDGFIDLKEAHTIYWWNDAPFSGGVYETPLPVGRYKVTSMNEKYFTCIYVSPEAFEGF